MTVITLYDAEYPTATNVPQVLNADVIPLANGGYAATWLSDTGDGDGQCVIMQIYAADGTPAGAEVVVNTTVTGNQVSPEMTQLSDGRFILVWASADTADGSSGCIRARIFNADGSPAGADFVVNTTGTGLQSAPEVAALGNGGFMVTWTSADTGDGSNGCVRGREYDAAGASVGNDFIVNTFTTGTQSAPEMLELANGGVLVAWSTGQFRFYESDGDPVAAGQLFAATNSNSRPKAMTELSDGRIAIAFESLSTNLVHVQIINADGSLSGSVINVPVAAEGTTFANSPQIVSLANGGFVVFWDQTQVAGSIQDFKMRVFNADGSPATDEVVIAHSDTGGIGFSSATVLANGNLLVFYNTNGSGDLLSQEIAITAGATATAFADVISGGAGVDSLSGLDGNDSLAGAGGNDTLNGGNGADTLTGGAGDDDLTGGTGNDVFRFAAGDGHDTVQDLTLGGAEDSIFVSGFLHYTKVQEGADLRIVFDANNSILIKNALAANFTAADINIAMEGDPNLVTGTGASETLIGTEGEDRILGLGGNDILRGYGDNDVLVGGDGNDDLQGGYGDDIMFGGAGNDTFRGGYGVDTASFEYATSGVTIDLDDATPTEMGEGQDRFFDVENAIGSAFNDHLIGDYNDNSLIGGDGDDILDGGGDNDVLVGGDGDDVFIVGGDYGDHDIIVDFVAGGAEDRIEVLGFSHYTLVQEGADLRVVFDAETSVLLLNTLAANFTAADINIIEGATTTINGTEGADTLDGTSTPNIINALGGADTINGLGGTDTIDGGDGDDTVNGGDHGDDILGGLGADTLNGDAGDDDLYGGDGTDTLNGGAGNDEVVGGAGADLMTGGEGDDELRGDDGDDVLLSSAGADKFTGGLGIDTVDYSAHAGAISITSGGTQSGTGDVVGDQFFTIERFILTAFNDSFAGGADVWGGEGNDTMTSTGSTTEAFFGEAGNDTLSSGSQSDTLDGGAGDDDLTGGTDSDQITGGTGDDTIRFGVGHGNDTVTDFTAGGTEDRIVVTGYGSYLLEQQGANLLIILDENNSILLLNVQEVNFTVDDINIVNGLNIINGTEVGETIDGTDGADQISGLGGADILHGGLGNDRIYGGDGDDLIEDFWGNDIIDGGAGIDTLDFSLYPFGDAINVNLNLTTIQNTGHGNDILSGFENVIATLAADTVIGTAAANTFWGGFGVDTLWGGDGDDVLYGEDSRDHLYGEGGNDTLYGGEGSDVIEGGVGNDYMHGGDETGIVLSNSVSYEHATAGVIVNLSLAGAQDTIGAGIDTLVNFNGVIGSAFNDVLGTSAVSGYARGGAGDDILKSNAGPESGSYPSDLYGDEGNDILIASLYRDNLHGGDGIDTVDFSTWSSRAVQTLFGSPGQSTSYESVENMNGSAFNDEFTGDDSANVLWGRSGDDILVGSGGDDTLEGGLGADTLTGGAGNDVIRFTAGDGHDTVNGFTPGGSDDRIEVTGYTTCVVTQQGADVRVWFEASNSILLKGTSLANFTAADINIAFTTAANALVGTSGNDTLNGTSANESIFGLAGNDTIKGLDGDDVLDGGDGNDVIEGGLGNDSLEGGAGTNDRADYRLATSAVTVNLALNTAQNTVGAGIDTLSGFEGVIGSAFNDTLTGNSGANTLDGRNGNDVLNGGSGGDILIGGLGADAMNGGGDLDYASYVNATAGVGLNLTTGVHTGEALGDTFVNIERYRLSAHNDSFVGTAATDHAYGAEGDDTLSGAAGVDRLYGQDGIDTLNGDAGNDILLGGAGADIFNGGADRDTASYEESSIAITMNLATGVHTGDAAGDTFNSVEIFWLSLHADTFTGSAGIDEVRGYDGDDTLNGGSAADSLRGENGIDTLNGDDGDDFLYGGAGGDILNGGLGVDSASYLLATAGVTINLTTGTHTGEAAGDTFTSIEHFQLSNGFTLADSFTGSAGDDWVAGYKGVDTLNGMGGNDTLNGGDHNDVINGGDGADKIIGEGGNDNLTGGTGADQFRVTTLAFGNDTITDFQNGVDKIRVTGVAAWNDFSDVVVSTNGSGWAVVTFSDGSSITLTGMIATDVDASDFL